MKDLILQVIKTAPEKALTVDEILRKCNFLTGFEGKKLRGLLQEMVHDGSVVMTARGKFGLGENLGEMKGKIVGNTKGFAFFEPDGSVEDYFIAERNLNGACHGDRVVCKAIVQKGRKRNARNNFRGRKEAEVVRIEKRGFEKIVGTYVLSSMGNIVVPDDKRFAEEIFLDEVDGTIARNTKVVVEILEYPTRIRMCKGKICEVLGDAGDLKVSTLSVVRSFNLIETFHEEVEKEAKKVATEITEKDLKGRKDFRKDLTITIDGEDARDFDDAISVCKKGDLWCLGVHIADVSHYVKQGSAIDNEAFKRGTSVYFPDMVLPMLPVELSNNMCSLNENVDRLTLSVVMDIDNLGQVKNFEICNGVIRSNNRMTYTKVQKMLDGDAETRKTYAHLVPMIEDMSTLAQILIKKREGLGSIDFDLPETQFELNDKYEVLSVGEKPRTLADRIIEQFMVLTNEVVAEFSVKHKLPFVYRVHESPLPEKLKAFNKFIATFGINAMLPSADVKPIEVQSFLKKIDGEPYESVVNKVMLRTMQKAVYYEQCNGHFGLASQYYCHFTSPIRRYPDLIIHRILKAYLAGELEGAKRTAFEKFVPVASEQSSTTEQIADTAERAVDDLKKAEYMSKHIGEEFVGICNGVSEFGVFVVLDNTCEGFIPKESLPKDNYVYEPERYRLIGKRNCFQLGNKITVKMESADLVLRRCNFAFISKQDLVQSDMQRGVMRGKIPKRQSKNAKKHTRR